jgi:hypothetical protein
VTTLISVVTVLTYHFSEYDWDGCIGQKLYVERFQMFRGTHHGRVTVLEMSGTYVILGKTRIVPEQKVLEEQLHVLDMMHVTM